ncbi:MAG: alanine--tRNA ligase [Candidatus Cloacimonetes bacterium 4572_65]|nr:MAG: alanine--tRNA ligase [Candidatus Cloacimonetes bacterium 4572_65]
MVTSSEIRQQFIDFFKAKEHVFVKSAPVVPLDDPTLLFINAGMNQFKSIFLGLEDVKTPRVVNSQKCIRAGGKHNDLDEVGKDGYHHTFFEMLGNWSFGDYYKKEAIVWAWELITDVWKIDKSKLYATVHHTDEEAFNLWRDETDINPDHISYHGDKDNFWEMGETGPCGPCSELHFDRGTDFCGVEGEHNCDVNGDCHRYMEIWNLVFMQYFREKDNTLTPLKMRHVDTGSGFERICQLLQNKDSNYHTDLFMPIIEEISKISGHEYNPKTSVSHRVIADHIRAITFSLADGGMPSNEGRGYVIRRILRRAARFGRLLDLKKPFLYKLVDVVIDVMGDHFVEIKDKKDYIVMVIKAEEERFNQTLDKGLEKFDDICKCLSGKIIPGESAFLLYDTFGFPVDLTSIIAEEKGLTVDMEGFNIAMEAQKERARQSSKFVLEVDETGWTKFSESKETQFVGYETLETEANILRYSIDKKNVVSIVLDKTPCYAESGGQVGDKGNIKAEKFEINLFDTKKINGLWVHLGKLISGEIEDCKVIISLNKENRVKTSANHSATHLLHSALRTVLGTHVQQKGSLVDSKGLRFDFTHFNGMSTKEIELVENMVNEQILKSSPLLTEVKTIEEAREDGAMALFGEKYGDSVRVVSISDFSKELCGGTHVSNVGEIGLLKIVSESSSAAGIRRIEALTGLKVLELLRTKEEKLAKISSLLGSNEKNIESKIEKSQEELKNLQKELESIKAQQSSGVLDDLIKSSTTIADVKVVSGKVNVANPNELRQIGDQLKDKIGSGIGILIAPVKGKVSVLVIVTKDLTKRFQAGKIVGKIAEIVGGRGGGRPDSAMAGGKDISKIDEALEKVTEILETF